MRSVTEMTEDMRAASRSLISSAAFRRCADRADAAHRAPLAVQRAAEYLRCESSR